MITLEVAQLFYFSIDIPNLAAFVAAMLMLARLMKRPAR
jgi:hypothetical protein